MKGDDRWCLTDVVPPDRLFVSSSSTEAQPIPASTDPDSLVAFSNTRNELPVLCEPWAAPRASSTKTSKYCNGCWRRRRAGDGEVRQGGGGTAEEAGERTDREKEGALRRAEWTEEAVGAARRRKGGSLRGARAEEARERALGRKEEGRFGTGGGWEEAEEPARRRKGEGGFSSCLGEAVQQLRGWPLGEDGGKGCTPSKRAVRGVDNGRGRVEAAVSRRCGGGSVFEASLELATSTMVSVKAEKHGGLAVHPIGKASGNATNGSSPLRCGKATPSLGDDCN